MPLTPQQNQLRTIRMTDPEWMPFHIGLCPITWQELGAELEQVVLRHPRTWPEFEKGSVDWNHLEFRPVENPDCGDFVDSWGCVWRTTRKGIVGTVRVHPLEDLSRLDAYVPPDPATHTHMDPIDWDEHRRRVKREKAAGDLPGGGLDHGYHLLRLEYLRGFENLMCDLATDTPEIRRVVDMVHTFNRDLLGRMIDTGAEMIGLPEDLGMQTGSMLGPRLFRQWVTPYHKELHDLAHASGCLTGFHCDGNIMDVADQILEIGPDVFNPQDLANGVDEFARAFKGRLCIALDFDRQHHTPFGTRREIADLVEREVKTLGSPNGGLSIQAEVRGPVPPENVDALADALETWSTYWFEKH